MVNKERRTILLESLAQLQHADFMVRLKAVEALAKIPGEKALSSLLAALQDSHPYVQEAAVRVLGQKRASRAVPGLVALLKDSYYKTRCAAAEALARIADPCAIDPLIEALRDLRRPEDMPTRRVAAEALGRIKDARALDALLGALHDNRDEVSQAAAEALVEIADARVVERLMSNVGEERMPPKGYWLLEKFGPVSVEPLLQELHNTRSRVRASAAGLLGEIGDPRAAEALVDLLGDPDEGVRDAAARALLAIASQLAARGHPSSAPLLLKLTRRSDMAAAAVDALVDLLKRAARRVARQDLVELAHLESVKQVTWEPVREADYEGNEAVWHEVDCAELRRLAQKEATRRTGTKR